MAFSEFLNSRREDCRQLVRELSKTFSYVGILGADVKSSSVHVNKKMSDIGEGSMTECGFVIKMHNGRSFFEYSVDDIRGDKKALADKILAAIAPDPTLDDRQIQVPPVADEPMVRSFSRECDFDCYSDEDLLRFAKGIRDDILSADERIVNAIVRILPFTVSKLFVSGNRELDQFYSWVNIMSVALFRDGEKMVMAREGTYSNLMKEAMEAMPARVPVLVERCASWPQPSPLCRAYTTLLPTPPFPV